MQKPTQPAYRNDTPSLQATLLHEFRQACDARRAARVEASKKLLGHATIVTTMRYAYMAPHVGRNAVWGLDSP
jgi:hypothetical protein